jgi:hypothetical protein
MSQQIEVARVVQFGQNILHLSQQKASRLRNAVLMEPGIRGKRFSRDQVGAVNARKRTTRHGDTPLIETPHSRRWLTTSTYDWADLVDNVDKLKAIEDPTNVYALTGAAAMGRAMDDEIINAFFATAITGEEAGGTVAFPASQVVAVNSWAYGAGSGNAGLTISKLIEAKTLLDQNEAGTDPDEQRYIAVSAKQVANLLATTEVSSADYNTVRALVQGTIDTFMGFTFIRTERLQVDSNNYRRVPAWVKSGMCLGLVEDVVSRISERADKNYSTQVYAEMDIGATRMEEVKVVEVKCLE